MCVGRYMAVAVGVAGGLVCAQESATAAASNGGMIVLIAERTPPGKGDMTDAHILALLETANTHDIETGQMAQQKAAHPKVKMYGHRMSGAHTAMLNDGAKMAKHLMLIPAQPDEAHRLRMEHEKVMQELRAFDHAYIEHEIEAHQMVLDQIDNAMKAANHQELKQLLEKTRPAIENHLHAAEDIRKSLSS